MATNRRAFICTLFSPALMPLAQGTARATAATRPVLTPEEEEGPFYIAGEHYRGAIAEGRPGVPLEARIRVLDAATGKPIRAAAVDIWHCDALGEYSGYAAMPPPRAMPGGGPPIGPPPHGFGRPPGGPPPAMGSRGPGPGGPPHAPIGNGKTFLRGIQLTDDVGMVRFLTIFPGFYAGRTNHIHLKVHLDTSRSNVSGRVVHTGQMFFPENLARDISARDPYARHHIERVAQGADHVFTDERGSSSIAAIEESPRPGGGYVAALTVAVRR